jgi:hypothetical protein
MFLQQQVVCTKDLVTAQGYSDALLSNPADAVITKEGRGRGRRKGHGGMLMS